jgi:uncharacterized protein YggT (Ycf19 family)
MDDLLLRLSVLARVVVPLLLFMAWLYLLLHILFARIVRQPDSPLLWFFAVVTGPLTRPVRALLPPSTPEPRVRLVALAVYVALWLFARIGLATVGPASPG